MTSPKRSAEFKSQSAAGGLAGLETIAREAGAKGIPPVEKWEPDFCGDLDIRIAADGTWYYLGSPIGRKPLVRLFSSVLRKDADGRTYLVTPVEKIGITVDDAPFLAVEMAVEGTGRDQRIGFRTNVDDFVAVDGDHPLRFETEAGSGGLKPYVLVRGRLETLVVRSVFYDLVELGEEQTVDGTVMFGVWSQGTFFPMAPADSLAGLR
ncbi:DUF1285 domain-containing protein [Microbaculum sp. FT89]|uniref:DUF1285 domain-containing protein n=1 Tax=Microbaculum sp. FT89 TaxID=3447298 RepID=UPI003F52916B